MEEHPDFIVDRFFALHTDLLSIIDQNGFFVKLNPASTETLGYDLSEMMGKSFLEYIHPDDQEATDRAAQSLQRKGAISKL